MKPALSADVARFIRNRHLFLVLVALVLAATAGCSSCLGRRPPAEGPMSQTPTAPLPVVAMQTPVSPTPVPGQTPASPTQTPTIPQAVPAMPDEPDSPTQYTTNILLDITPGMTYREVEERLGSPGVVIAGRGREHQVYRWSHSGMSFLGRFEDGKLTRKNTISPDPADYPWDEEVLEFDQDLYERLHPGMTFDEVFEIIGMDAQPLTSDSSPVRIYKWTDEYGSSITARFENQVLIRKSGVIIQPGAESAGGRTPRPESDTQAPLEDTVAYEEEEVFQEPHLAEQSIPFMDAPPPVDAQPGQETSAAPPRVRVVGAERREREIAQDPSPHAGRSYRPTVKLPDFRRRLRGGSYEIQIINTTASRARVAIISDAGGLELSIAASGRSAVRVNRGTYQIYFIYEDDPYTLHQGQQIPVEEWLTDFVVYLFDDSSQVDML